MNLGKGLAFSAVGALAGAVVWIILVKVTGWSLWVLAPIVGGAAGYGMMRATQMKGGMLAGVGAAGMTIAAVFGARYFIVTQDVQARLAVTDDEAISLLAAQIAADLEERGHEAFDEDGNYTARVERKTREVWDGWSAHEREQYIGAQQQERESMAGVLTPLGLLFDFGIFGTICTVLAAGTAFKTASTTLEKALVDKGLVAGEEDAAGMAKKMREEDSAKSSPTAGWSMRMQLPDERPVTPIKLTSIGDQAAARDDDGSTGQKVA